MVELALYQWSSAEIVITKTALGLIQMSMLTLQLQRLQLPVTCATLAMSAPTPAATLAICHRLRLWLHHMMIKALIVTNATIQQYQQHDQLQHSVLLMAMPAVSTATQLVRMPM